MTLIGSLRKKWILKNRGFRLKQVHMSLYHFQNERKKPHKMASVKRSDFRREIFLEESHLERINPLNVVVKENTRFLLSCYICGLVGRVPHIHEVPGLIPSPA